MLLDVSISLTVWYNEYGVNINRKFLCPDDLLLKKHKYKACRLFVFSTKRRGITTVPYLVSYHFIASQRRISPTTVRKRLPKASLYSRRPVVCVPLNRRQKRPTYVVQEHIFLRSCSNELLYFTQMTPNSHWRVIQGVC